MIESCNCGPFTSTFLSGGIKNLINKWLIISIFICQYITSNLNKVTVKFTFVPFIKNKMHLISSHMKQVTHHLVGFTDQLHITIFDAIVNHFYKMTGTIFANPVTAWCAIIHFGSDSLKDWFHVWPCSL